MTAQKTRWLTVLYGAVLLGALIASSLCAWQPPPRIGLVDIHRIEVGMSQAEVEAVLGGPPGDYCTTVKVFFQVACDMSAWPEDCRRARWTSDDGGVDVGFDESGKVKVIVTLYSRSRPG